MCFGGELKRLWHWGPLTALVIIKFVSGTTIHCMGMWWPTTSVGGFVNTICFISLSGLTMYNFLSSMFHGPGYLPLRWTPQNRDDCNYLQLCGICHGYKAPRSHHCRKCGRCVLKMDHHCPWINNCVGWGNHAHFTMFLAFATTACFHASIVLGSSLYRALNVSYYMHYGDGFVVYLGLLGVIFCVLALGLTIGVVIAVGMLLFFQLRAIIRNRTGIEDWIMEKAVFRRRGKNAVFKFPYDLGVWQNVRQVLNITCTPIGDGITWPVIEGCDQYTLTREQMEQKNEKRQRTKLYKVVKPASGSWLPISHGFKVFYCPPFSDEPRIKLNIGDLVTVTRWRTHWLFGEKIQKLPENESSLHRIRGWFPRLCAVEIKDTNEKKQQ